MMHVPSHSLFGPAVAWIGEWILDVLEIEACCKPHWKEQEVTCKSCPACLERLAPVGDLFLKAMLEFFAKIEWIAGAHKPCPECMVRHADDFGAKFVTETFGSMSDGLRQELYEKLVLVLLAKGVTDVTKTKAAYDGLKWPGRGKLANLGALLKALYGGRRY